MLKSAKLNGFHNLELYEKKYMENTIIYLVNKIIIEENCEMVSDTIIVNALRIIHKNLSKKLSIDEIANQFNLSTEGFIRKFKKYMGVTPYAYLKNLRIRTALAMRLEGHSLAEIAEECGYSDPSALLHAMPKNKSN